jgi:hypothetical protein
MYYSCELYFDTEKLIICDCAHYKFFKEKRWQNKLSQDVYVKGVEDTFYNTQVVIDIHDLHVVECSCNNGGSEGIRDLQTHGNYNTLNYIRFLNIVLFYKINYHMISLVKKS